MKTGVTIALGAAVAAATALAVVTLFPPAPAPGPGAGTEGTAAADAGASGLTREVESLRARVATLESLVEKQSVELARARRRSTAVEPAPDDAADASPEAAAEAEQEGSSSELSPKRDATARKGKKKPLTPEEKHAQAMKGLQRMIDPSPEYVRRQQQGTLRGVRRLGERFKLTTETMQAMARALIEEDRRIRAQFRDQLTGRDLTGVTVEDLQPLVSEMFAARDRAMTPHLAPDQVETVRREEAERHTAYVKWLRESFPSRGR